MPAVIVSPLIKPGVDHTVYDHTSVLATIENLFGLDPLTARDKTANNFIHLLADAPVSGGPPSTILFQGEAECLRPTQIVPRA